MDITIVTYPGESAEKKKEKLLEMVMDGEYDHRAYDHPDGLEERYTRVVIAAVIIEGIVRVTFGDGRVVSIPPSYEGEMEVDMCDGCRSYSIVTLSHPDWAWSRGAENRGFVEPFIFGGDGPVGVSFQDTPDGKDWDITDVQQISKNRYYFQIANPE